MEKEIKESKNNKEEISKFLKNNIEKSIGSIRNYTFDENGRFVEEYKR